MTTMQQIESFIQNVAEAIAAVIDIEVTVVDDNFTRIVGTGMHRDMVGQKITSGSIAWQVFESGKLIVVEEPRKDEKCRRCTIKDTCNEYAEILYPIIMNNKVIGVIGLIAFSDAQKERLMSNKHYLNPFIDKMASLICSKLSELEKTNQIHSLNNELEKIVDNIDKAIIATDRQLNIRYINNRLKEYFNFHHIQNRHISSILDSQDFLEHFDKEKSLKDYIYINSSEHFLINSYELGKNNFLDNVNYLFIIRKVSDIQEKEYRTRANILQRGHIAKWHFDHIISSGMKMKSLVEEAKHYSQANSTVTIIGESGTGKEIIAQCIHNYSRRKQKPFVAINCAAIPENLLESILFGYAPGAFTGANKQGKAGLFELAHTGTIFLDEIGDMNFSLQAHLLRVLEEKEILRVGGDKVIPVDVRIITATNRILEEDVQNGKFREDLFYRLNVLNIHIPPLRERKDEIPIFAQQFLDDFANEYELNEIQLDSDLIELLCEYDWPGNIRQLRNIMERIAIKSRYQKLDKYMIENTLYKKRKSELYVGESIDIDFTGNFKDVERQIIKQVMSKSKNLDEVSEKLGLSKTTIWRRLQNE
ncbi:sigma 54-interacting transcriptional regulator [Wukongibacter baidiensis]|uniref:sigma-54 interaction domain-containing protein n=1 Tax=Wukongibacter baidiensis TaxID=1723361 RepID=UPI003D7FE28D